MMPTFIEDALRERVGALEAEIARLTAERDALAAELAKRGEPVAWRYRCAEKLTAWTDPTFNRRSPYGRIGMEEQALYAHPAPASAGVTVKPLEWEYSVTTYTDREAGKELPAAEFWQADTILLRGRYTIMRLVDARVRGDRESYRLNVGREDQKHPTLDAAKAAAQADYEARIISDLSPTAEQGEG